MAFSRLGVYIRLPGVDVDRFAESLQGGGLLSYIDALSGGSVSRVGLFSLGTDPFNCLSHFPEVSRLGTQTMALACLDSAAAIQTRAYLTSMPCTKVRCSAMHESFHIDMMIQPRFWILASYQQEVIFEFDDARRLTLFCKCYAGAYPR